MIDPLSDDLISLNEAAKICPNRPHRHTIYRWCVVGVRGRKLESVLLGGSGLYTSKDALREFLLAISRRSDSSPPKGKSSERVAKAEKRLTRLQI